MKTKQSLPQHMIREITSQEPNYEKNHFEHSPYMILPYQSKTEQQSPNIEKHNDGVNAYFELKQSIQHILEEKKEDDVILEIYGSAIKLKYLWLFEEKNIIHESMMLFVLGFLKDKQVKQNKKIFTSQIVLVRISQTKAGFFEYKYFLNKERKKPDDLEDCKYFLYLLQINNHWTLAMLDTVTLICTIYPLCQQIQENFPSLISKVHQSFMNFPLEECVVDESFSSHNENDDGTHTCSLLMNYILISLFVHESVPSIPKTKKITNNVLKENQRKILKIVYNFLKKSFFEPKPSPLFQRKSVAFPDSRIRATTQIQNNGQKSLATALLKIKKNSNSYDQIKERMSGLHPPKSGFKITMQKAPQTSENSPKTALKKKSRFFKNNTMLPNLNPSSNSNSIEEEYKESFHSQPNMKKGVTLTKNDILPIMSTVKQRIISEILEKMHDKREEENTEQKRLYKTRLEGFMNYQTYLNYYYYNNPALYQQLLDEYNKRYYKYLMKNFGLPDKEYEKSEHSSEISKIFEN